MWEGDPDREWEESSTNVFWPPACVVAKHETGLMMAQSFGFPWLPRTIQGHGAVAVGASCLSTQSQGAQGPTSVFQFRDRRFHRGKSRSNASPINQALFDASPLCGDRIIEHVHIPEFQGEFPVSQRCVTTPLRGQPSCFSDPGIRLTAWQCPLRCTRAWEMFR